MSAEAAWFYLRVNEEGDPANDNEQAWGKIVGYNIEGGLAGEDELEAGHGVVHVEGGVAGVLGVQGVDVDVVVEDGPDGLFLDGDELISAAKRQV